MFKERIKSHHSAMGTMNKYVLGKKNIVSILNKENPSNNSLGTIYIHVPFCSKICSFCNMQRKLQNARDNYHKYIIKEIAEYGKLNYTKNLKIDAIYFGGGTPTMLSPIALQEILISLKNNFTLTSDAEITIETTVSELTNQHIEFLGENGVNRFSVGVQTFNDLGRQQMNRKGSGENAYKKLEQLKSNKNFTVSMDIIYNYSGQTIKHLEDDLNKIISLDLDGFSMYSLINMQKTEIEKSQDLETDYNMFKTIANTMEKKNYNFLELTKMVKNDNYKYIMNRHLGVDTIPLGAGAGGGINGLMKMNPINLDEYYSNVNNFKNLETMYFSKEYKDTTIFKGDIQTLTLPKNTDLYLDKNSYLEILKELVEEKYVVEKNSIYYLTHKGIFWGNTISRTLYDLI